MARVTKAELDALADIIIYHRRDDGYYVEYAYGQPRLYLITDLHAMPRVASVEIESTITLAALIGVAFTMGGVWRDVKALKDDVKAIKRRVFDGADRRTNA